MTAAAKDEPSEMIDELANALRLVRMHINGTGVENHLLGIPPSPTVDAFIGAQLDRVEAFMARRK